MPPFDANPPAGGGKSQPFTAPYSVESTKDSGQYLGREDSVPANPAQNSTHIAPRAYSKRI